MGGGTAARGRREDGEARHIGSGLALGDVLKHRGPTAWRSSKTPSASSMYNALVSEHEMPSADDLVEFEGAVLPASSSLALSCTVEAQHLISADSVRGPLSHIRLNFEINGAHVQGQVVVVAAPSLLELRAFTTKTIQQELDIQGFLRGEGLVVNLHRWRAAGVETTYDDHIPELRAERLEDDVSDIFRRSIVHRDLGPALGWALNDLRAAIVDRDRSSMHCGRAIESIRQVFYRPEDGKHAKESWKRMREALGLAEDDLKVITEASMPSRHGAMPYRSPEERLALIRMVRQVAVAYARYVSSMPESK